MPTSAPTFPDVGLGLENTTGDWLTLRVQAGVGGLAEDRPDPGHGLPDRAENKKVTSDQGEGRRQKSTVETKMSLWRAL